MAILPVKSPCTITIISIGTSLVLVVLASHVGCCEIFRIWNNCFLSDPLWKLICVFFGWVPARASSLWPPVFLYMSLLATLVKSHILLYRRPPSRVTTISTVAYLEVKFLKSLVYQLSYGDSLWLCNWMLVFILLLSGRRSPLLWIDNIAVF